MRGQNIKTVHAMPLRQGQAGLFPDSLERGTVTGSNPHLATGLQDSYVVIACRIQGFLLVLFSRNLFPKSRSCLIDYDLVGSFGMVLPVVSLPSHI